MQKEENQTQSQLKNDKEEEEKKPLDTIDCDAYQYLKDDPRREEIINHYERVYRNQEGKTQELSSYIKGLEHNQDHLVQLESAILLRKLLSLEEDPPIQQILESGVIKTLINIIETSKDQLLRAEAIWGLVNAARGNSEQIDFLAQKKVPELFIKALEDNLYMVKQAVWGVSNLAANSVSKRNQLLDLGGMGLVVKVYRRIKDQGIKFYGFVDEVIWSASNLCRLRPSPHYSKIIEALPMFVEVLKKRTKNITFDRIENHRAVITDIMFSVAPQISYSIIASILDSAGLIQIVIKLLDCILEHNRSHPLIHVLLRIIGGFTNTDSSPCQSVISGGGLKTLSKALSLDREILRKERGLLGVVKHSSRHNYPNAVDAGPEGYPQPVDADGY